MINSSASPGDNMSFYVTPRAPDTPMYWAGCLVVLPLVCVIGNCLVVLAVLTERTLKTTTNFLLVSLAVADLIVGVAVMPGAIYIAISHLSWDLPQVVCRLWQTFDVFASTCSITHLVAISIDRFFAVVRHVEYKTAKHQRRVYATILFCWLFSATIGLPVGIAFPELKGNQTSGLNMTSCVMADKSFMLFGSIVSFYVPCVVMLIMYGFVFVQLNQRMRTVRLHEKAAGQMVNFGDHIAIGIACVIGIKPIVNPMVRQISKPEPKPVVKPDDKPLVHPKPRLPSPESELLAKPKPSAPKKRSKRTKPVHGCKTGSILSNVYGERDNARANTMSWAMPFLRTIEATIEEDDSMSSDEIEELTTILHTLETDTRIKQMPTGIRDPLARGRKYRAIKSDGNINEEDDDDDLFSPMDTIEKDNSSVYNKFASGIRNMNGAIRRRKSIHRAGKKIVSLKDRAVQLLMKMRSKQGMQIRKETRATKLVATVMVTFLMCWLPFFTLNIINAVSDLQPSKSLTTLQLVFTWLGYLNSCLNPIIYSSINRKFRAAFRRLLRLPAHDRRTSALMRANNERRTAIQAANNLGNLPTMASSVIGRNNQFAGAGTGGDGSDFGYASSTTNFTTQLHTVCEDEDDQGDDEPTARSETRALLACEPVHHLCTYRTEPVHKSSTMKTILESDQKHDRRRKSDEITLESQHISVPTKKDNSLCPITTNETVNNNASRKAVHFEKNPSSADGPSVVILNPKSDVHL